MDGRHCRSRIRLKKIVFTQTQKQILADHADKELPNESCAILFGDKNSSNFKVEKIFLTENIEKSAVNFTISPEQTWEASRMEKEQELQIIGIFHSHPNSEAYPSSTDKKFMELNPVTWVIFSGRTREFKAYSLDKIIEDVLIETQ